jgi:hypothetical protein
MATMPALFKKNQAPMERVLMERTLMERTTGEAANSGRVRADRDPFQLRDLPHESVYLYCKKIDNSRLVREADPKAPGACWSAIGAAGVLAVLLTTAFAPTVGTTIAGYKLEELRIQERQLIEERRVLELQQAELLSPAHLDQLARDNNLVEPAAGQVFHLEEKPRGAVAMAK